MKTEDVIKRELLTELATIAEEANDYTHQSREKVLKLMHNTKEAELLPRAWCDDVLRKFPFEVMKTDSLATLKSLLEFKPDRRSIKFVIKGEPFSKQSARFIPSKRNDGKIGIHSYKSEKVKVGENNVIVQVLNQIPPGFKPFDKPLKIKVTFVYSPPKHFPQYKRQLIAVGKRIYKDTIPDLQDNLMKGLIDAMQGKVFVNDSRIAHVTDSYKIYGEVPRTEIEITEIN